MCLMYVQQTSIAFEWTRLAKMIVMLALPSCKLLLLIVAVKGLGNAEADDLRQLIIDHDPITNNNWKSVNVQRSKNILLKQFHEEKYRGYISASGFFPLNCSLLFQV